MTGQPPRRALHELINMADPAWPLVERWIAEARTSVEVVPAERARGEQALLALQITTRSPMGAIALETAGIFIDYGWLRILGAGGPRIRDGLLSWNGLGDEPVPEPLAGAFLVAHDAVGGFFALNGGALGGRHGDVSYFGPDRLTWEDLEVSYSDFLYWALTGELTRFYDGVRWPGWEREVARLDGDQGISIYPMLCFAGGPVGDRSREAVPMRELWTLHRDLAHQLDGVADGTEVDIHLRERRPPAG
jgi:hypothetical protein